MLIIYVDIFPVEHFFNPFIALVAILLADFTWTKWITYTKMKSNTLGCTICETSYTYEYSLVVVPYKHSNSDKFSLIRFPFKKNVYDTFRIIYAALLILFLLDQNLYFD